MNTGIMSYNTCNHPKYMKKNEVATFESSKKNVSLIFVCLLKLPSPGPPKAKQPLRVFLEKILKNSKILQENTFVGVFFLWTLSKETIKTRCFLLGFVKHLRKTILKNSCEQLLLKKWSFSLRTFFVA